MAKFRMNEFKQHMAAMQGIIDDFSADRAAEKAAATDNGERLERPDQPGAQDSAHEPAVTRAYRTLEQIPGFDRLRKNSQSLPPTQISQDHFFPTKK